jgi:hypothetical protein
METVDAKFEISGSYRQLEEMTEDGKRLTAWVSSTSEDAAWDRFLQEVPQGQFQQSAMWARTKAAEGWMPVRVLITLEGKFAGGFQLLGQSSWPGRIGYVSKGPVILPGRPALEEYAIHLLREVAGREGLRALVVQPPDLCAEMSSKLESNGFMPNFLTKVNCATWIVGLKEGFEALEKNMSHTTRNLVRRAVKMGLTIREGGRQDLVTFFDLMLVSCRHQGVKPNPPELKHLLSLWDALFPSGCVRLYFAEYEGKPLSGHLDILFGKTATMWKVGGRPGDKALAPNDFIFQRGIQWASQNGYDRCDFAAFDRQMAVSILQGNPFSEKQQRSRYLFLTRFGGRPRLLPLAQVYFPNRLLRSAYRVCLHKQLRKIAAEARAIQGIVAPAEN